MIEITVNNLNKYYGSNHVIKDISFEINTGERVGLLGKNGSGKTTIFKILSGKEFYEIGIVAKATNKKVEMLAQIPVFNEKDTCEDVLRSAFIKTTEIYNAMKEIEGSLEETVLEQYGELLEQYEQLGGYETEVKLDKICNGMKIDENLRKSLFSQVSGGEQSRVNLARILLEECDILLLDEPTNHLDLETLSWLENFLLAFKGTIVVISHDRCFLDNVVTRIIELDSGKVNFILGIIRFIYKKKNRDTKHN